MFPKAIPPNGAFDPVPRAEHNNNKRSPVQQQRHRELGRDALIQDVLLLAAGSGVQHKDRFVRLLPPDPGRVAGGEERHRVELRQPRVQKLFAKKPERVRPARKLGVLQHRRTGCIRKHKRFRWREYHVQRFEHFASLQLFER